MFIIPLSPRQVDLPWDDDRAPGTRQTFGGMDSHHSFATHTDILIS